MHVFFDDQTFVAQEQGGISRYFTALARELGRQGVPVHVFGGITRNIYLPALINAAQVTTRFRTRRDRWRINTWVARVSQLGRRLDFWQLRRHSSNLIYHATNYDLDPWIAKRAAATCLTVFDMIGELMCDEASRERSLSLKRRSVPLADVIFCISAQTRKDFLVEFPACANAAKVTPLAASLPVPSAENLAIASRHHPYLLLVGNRAGYKNGVTALRAFAALNSSHPKLQLVCFGGEPFSREEQTLLALAHVQNRTAALRGDDGLLAAYYAGASALLYPSRYEGFGLPVLEAMQLGCPVITTRCASLPEVAGEAALYAHPDYASEFSQAADRLLVDEAWRRRWIESGRIRAQHFSWQQTARATRTQYLECLARKSGKTVAGASSSLQAFSRPGRK